MTETEIMKATECCKSGDCVSCPLSSNRYESKCKDILFETVIDLINRKNASIEELIFENLQMVASIKGLEGKAIKEFAERLKKRYWNIPMWGKVAVVFMEEIAKEMGCNTDV